MARDIRQSFYKISQRFIGIVDLTFRILTCRFLLAVVSCTMRSGLYQLVIRVRGFRVCALHCDLAITSIPHCIIRFCPSAWTPRFQEVELCIASARTTLAVSAVAPSYSFSAAANQKPFVNKDLCTRKSVKRTIKVVRAKRFASAWQLKMLGSFSRELNQYSYNH